MAARAPAEKLAYVASFDPQRRRKDAIAVVDLKPGSSTYAQIVGRVEMSGAGDELHHFGWNACSSCLCPNMPHPHVERRYLIVPGLRSSRIHILDTKPDPKNPKVVKVIEPDELADRTGYSRPHTVHCGPGGGIELAPDFFLKWPAGHLPHQVRLQGGDASSDSYCYP